jgi:hypothetical protein
MSVKLYDEQLNNLQGHVCKINFNTVRNILDNSYTVGVGGDARPIRFDSYLRLIKINAQKKRLLTPGCN